MGLPLELRPPNSPEASSAGRILLTGATGYVGGRLLKRLEATGRPLRCLARRPEYLRARAATTTEIVAGDCLDRPSLDRALAGVQVAYYLVHSMGSAGRFESVDREAAANFGEAARKAGVQRIIYLGGLGDPDPSLSSHLRSRQEVGEVLRSSGVPVIELRASIVIGSGSVSFELVRALVERLPVMVTPRWVSTPAQPIAIEDLLDYLTEALDLPLTASRTFEIGGADRVSYADIMREYAHQRGLRRWILRVPLLTPRLSSLWLGLVTSVYARVGRKLIDGVRNPTVVRNPKALEVFKVRPRGLREAIERALRNEDEELAATRWSDALSSGNEPPRWGGVRFASRLVDSRETEIDTPPAAAFRPIRRIGGKTGWYGANFLWRLRGYVDLLQGGIGLRRGRRDPEHLQVGDVLDWWRVEAYEPDRLLRLAAELKVPGRAWLEFEVRPRGTKSVIRQSAVFDPLGLSGLLYWYSLYPLHKWVFHRMLRGIAKEGLAGRGASGAIPKPD
jgi:uncharacterized protein YbjT (DUF2867 family)